MSNPDISTTDTAAASRIYAAVWTLTHDEDGSRSTEPFTARDVLDATEESVGRRTIHDRLDDFTELGVLERADTESSNRWRPVEPSETTDQSDS